MILNEKQTACFLSMLLIWQVFWNSCEHECYLSRWIGKVTLIKMTNVVLFAIRYEGLLVSWVENLDSCITLQKPMPPSSLSSPSIGPKCKRTLSRRPRHPSPPSQTQDPQPSGSANPIPPWTPATAHPVGRQGCQEGNAPTPAPALSL